MGQNAPPGADRSVLFLIWRGLCQTCPKCNRGALYKSRFSLTMRDQCAHCRLDFSKNDSADGPAVFLIFFLGFLIVPIALLVSMNVDWPLWVHAILWGGLMLVMTIGLLRPLKSLVIAIQYHTRPDDWV